MNKPLKLLMAEDDAQAARALCFLLEKNGYDLTFERVYTADAMQSALASREWDLVISDYKMPGFSGEDALKLVKQTGRDLPFILLSGSIGEDTAVALMKAGASDFVSKADIARVVPSVDRELNEAKNRHDRRQAEQALKESEAKFLTLFESSRDAIMLLDSSGFVDCNQATLTLFGVPAKEIFITKHPADLSPPEQPDGQNSLAIANDQMKAALEQGSQFFEWTHIRADGTHFPAEVLLNRVELCGEMILQAVVRDVTERKQAEAKRAQMEQNCAQARKMESIGQLAAGIAHEINTPTQFIGDHTRFVKDSLAGITDLLKTYEQVFQKAKTSGSLPKEDELAVEKAREEADLEYVIARVPKALEQILEGINRVATIVRAMKDFSHPDQAEKVPANLNKYIESTVTVARNEWKYVADMELDLDKNLPFVTCLPGEINQVILNMIVNAAHAIGDVVGASGEKGKGRITITTRADDAWIEIRIADTGPGIPAHVQPRIFDPFFTTKEVGKGTGQGLAIAYNVIVKKHGGSIHFETAEGKGTGFVIRLPIGATKEQATPEG